MGTDLIIAPQQSVATYEDYYLRPINQLLQADTFGGFKLVVGPTGIGKTYAIPPTIYSLCQREGFDKRCIYATHRHILLEEMERDLKKFGVRSVYLKSNRDLVCDFVSQPQSSAFLADLEAIRFFGDMRLSEVDLLAQSIRRIHRDLERGVLSKETFSEMTRSLRRKCSKFIHLFEKGFREVSQANYSLLVQQEMVWRLFPYIEFLYNPAKPVLLVTVDKLLRGFFDGKRRQGITSLRNNIIFLDEFEIQESVILRYLCEDDGVRNNFEFVSLFYNEMASERELDFLTPLPTDPPERNEAKQQAIKLLDRIRQECDEGNYRFPTITRFTMGENEYATKKKNGKKGEASDQPRLMVFQSNYIAQTYPFYLVDEGRAWRIVKQRSGQTLSSSKLLYLMARAADDILEFFASLWASGLDIEWREWIALCYNKRNDNLSGAYQDIITSYGALRRPLKFLKLRNPEKIRSSVYYKGFSLYMLTRGRYSVTLPDEVDMHQKTMHITPEYLIWQLCQSNLLFGISATGDLPRYVRTFDLKWLQDNCNYLPIDDEDKALIAQMKAQKEQTRNYDVRLDMAGLLPYSHPLNNFLDRLATEGVFGEQGQIAITARRNVVNRFLETLRWIVQHSHNKAHLVFVNSINYILLLLERKRSMSEFSYDDLAQYLEVRRASLDGIQEYRVIFEGQPVYVILLNAEKARKHHLATFQYDPQLGPLVVVTQYETAANGVNLEWTDETGGKYDFQGIHLLEGKHFYFDQQQQPDQMVEDERPVDTGKMFVWQAWKLAEGRQISQRELRTYMGNWQNTGFNAISVFNSTVYKKTPDYLLNQVALFDQAFGRVDRKPNSTHITEVRLAHTSSADNSEDGVFQILARYLNEEGAIGRLRDERVPYTSTLILKIHEAIRERSRSQRLSNQFFREDISGKQARSRARIEELLSLIERMKSGAYSDEQSGPIKRLWLDVRGAVLSQDYQFEGEFEDVHIDFQRDFVHSTAYLQPHDKLYLDATQMAILKETSVDAHDFALNWPYRRLAENEAIKRFFEIRNYQLSYYHTTPNYIFVPHVIQAILAGAVGEAALEALLEQAEIELEAPYNHDTTLFEDFDLKIKGKPIYLDAKSFSRATIYRMNAEPTDPDYNPYLNGPLLLKKAQEKWQRIVARTGQRNTKFVIINLQVDGWRLNEYWDEQLNPVNNFQESAITIIQGTLDPASPNTLRPQFQLWLTDVQNIQEGL